MGLFSRWRKKNDRYRKKSSPITAAYLPGNIEKSHFVYSPKLSAREDCVFRPSIQQLAQTFAIENLKLDKPIGLPLTSYYLDLPEIALEPPTATGSLEPRTRSLAPGTGSLELGTGSLELGTGSLELGTGSLELGTGSLELGTGSLELGTGSPEPRTGSLELGTGSPEATNIKVIHVKPALDLWKNDESTGLNDDDNDELDLVKLVPSEIIIGPKGTKLIKVKPVKDSKYLVQETGAEPNSQLKTDLSQVADHHSKETQEQLKEPISRLDVKADNYSRSLTAINHTISSDRGPGRRRYMDYTNNNVSSDISTITLPESAFKPQAKPHPGTIFYVTRDNAWRGQSTSITDIKSNNKKKAKKDKVKYTNIETFREPMDKEEIKKKKCMNIFKRLLNRKYSVPDSNEIDVTMLNRCYNLDISSTMLDCNKYY